MDNILFWDISQELNEYNYVTWNTTEEFRENLTPSSSPVTTISPNPACIKNNKTCIRL